MGTSEPEPKTAGSVHGPRLLTVREFSMRYRRSRSRTYELIRSGELVAVKEGRSTLISVDAAEAWARTLAPISVPNRTA